MIAYLDSSVILRYVLEQPGLLEGVDEFEGRVTSLMTLVECMRAVDNARLLGDLGESEFMARRRAVHRKLRGVTRVTPTRSIVLRAGESLPTPLKALDAIHLATAVSYRDQYAPELEFATHDRQLGRAAEAMGFQVLGV